MMIKCEEFKSTHVIFELVNTEDNRKMLNEIPHRNFNDLSIIYRYVFHMDNNGIISCIIDNALTEKLKLTEKVLYALAVINTQQMFPATVESIYNVVGHLDQLTANIPKELPIYVIRNEKGIYGATAMLYTDTIQKLAENLNSDFYILPSSIHDILLVSAITFNDPLTLAEMVNEVNTYIVEPKERLSNRVYYYDRNLHVITMVEGEYR